MSGRSNLKRFLQTSKLDAGCAETFAHVDLYIERELAYGDAATEYPRIAEHLLACDPCAEDYRGLWALVG
jgi:hypothetical protein